MDDFTGKVVKEMCKKSGMGIDPMLLRVKSASITEPLPQMRMVEPFVGSFRGSGVVTAVECRIL